MARGPWKKTFTPKASAGTKARPRGALTLDTEEGRAEARQAGQWFLKLQREHLGGDVLSIIKREGADGSRLVAFNPLPGYDDALASARDALSLLAGRTDSVRELFRASRDCDGMSVPLMRALVLALAEYDGHSHLPYLPGALRASEATGDRRQFVRDLTVRERNAARKPLPKTIQGSRGRKAVLPFPWADVSPLRFVLAACWASLGFWLADDDDINNCLKGDSLLQAFRGQKPVVTRGAIREARKALELKGYKGAGRLRWLGEEWAPDVTLRAQPLPDNDERRRVLGLLAQAKLSQAKL